MKLTDKKITSKSVIDFIGKNYLYFGIAILVIFTAIKNPEILSAAPLHILNRTAAYVIMALGVGSIMMIGAGADLSVGRIFGITAIIATTLFRIGGEYLEYFKGNEALASILVCLLVILLGGIIGAFNGFIVGKFKLPAFIVTLCTQLIVYGATFIWMGKSNYHKYFSSNISNILPEYKGFFTNAIEIGSWSIPNYVWYAIIIAVLMWIIWKYTPIGKKMQLIGSNREAAKTMNINIIANTVIVFVMAGALYGINGLMEAARVGGAGFSVGANAEIDAIAACLLGGVSLKGGIGKIGGIVVGVILLQLVSVCLQWLTVSANYVYIIKGAILLLAITMDAVKHRA